MNKNLFKCKLCKGEHPDRTYFVNPKTLKRITGYEVNKIGLGGFGKEYKMARHCKEQKKYYTVGFIS